jgi:hypothetical protein
MTKEDIYAKAEYRGHWLTITPYEGVNLTVNFCGFESSINTLEACGWDITVEYNYFTGKNKLCFKSKANGLMARVAFQPDTSYISIPVLYAVKNYKLKAAKFTELVPELVDTDIPMLLEWIREVKKPVISEILWNEHTQHVKNKVVELKAYIKAKLNKAA